jgi:hypothetical protein
LFDDPTEEIVQPNNTLIVHQTIKILIEELEFRYGTIAFKYNIPEQKTELEFEIENLKVRPEFEVLKPYISKVLKTKNVNIIIHAEFENGKLLSQLATSTDVEKINHELIEGVKFTFVSKNILGKHLLKNENGVNINQIQDEAKNALYSSGEELLEDILKNQNFKHHKQLRFLSQKHDSNTLKIRFVLSPFSFVFLLTGNQQFHIVLETLDTEEATYIWHFPKDKQLLKLKLKEIDQHLNIIRSKGRQIFLETQPENFSRMLHDYSNDKKGFIIWKDVLEERIV